MVCPELVELWPGERIKDGFARILVRPGVCLVLGKLEDSGLVVDSVISVLGVRGEKRAYEEWGDQNICYTVFWTLYVSLRDGGLELPDAFKEIVEFLAVSTVGQDTVLEPRLVDVAVERESHESRFGTLDGILDFESSVSVPMSFAES